jgi:hypothetical protein
MPKAPLSDEILAAEGFAEKGARITDNINVAIGQNIPFIIKKISFNGPNNIFGDLVTDTTIDYKNYRFGQSSEEELEKSYKHLNERLGERTAIATIAEIESIVDMAIAKEYPQETVRRRPKGTIEKG